jgi:hypothetical protein
MSTAEAAAGTARPHESVVVRTGPVRASGASGAALMTLMVVSQLVWLAALSYVVFWLVT